MKNFIAHTAILKDAAISLHLLVLIAKKEWKEILKWKKLFCNVQIVKKKLHLKVFSIGFYIHLFIGLVKDLLNALSVVRKIGWRGRDNVNWTFKKECSDCKYYKDGQCTHPCCMYCEHCELWAPEENNNAEWFKVYLL